MEHRTETLNHGNPPPERDKYIELQPITDGHTVDTDYDGLDRSRGTLHGATKLPEIDLLQKCGMITRQFGVGGV